MSAATRALAGRIPAEHAPEIDRILGALARSGARLLAAPDLPRAVVTVPVGSDLETIAITSAPIAGMMAAAGLVLPGGAVGSVRHWLISPHGRAQAARCAHHDAEPVKSIDAPPGLTLGEIRAILSGPLGAEDRARLVEFFEAIAGPEDLAGLGREWAALGVALSGDELRLADRLARAAGRIVPAGILHRTFAAGRLDRGEIADPGLVRMVLRRLREKFERAGLPVKLETRRGLGSALVITAPGFVLPGQN